MLRLLFNKRRFFYFLTNLILITSAVFVCYPDKCVRYGVRSTLAPRSFQNNDIEEGCNFIENTVIPQLGDSLRTQGRRLADLIRSSSAVGGRTRESLNKIKRIMGDMERTLNDLSGLSRSDLRSGDIQRRKLVLSKWISFLSYFSIMAGSALSYIADIDKDIPQVITAMELQRALMDVYIAGCSNKCALGAIRLIRYASGQELERYRHNLSLIDAENKNRGQREDPILPQPGQLTLFDILILTRATGVRFYDYEPSKNIIQPLLEHIGSVQDLNHLDIASQLGWHSFWIYDKGIGRSYALDVNPYTQRIAEEVTYYLSDPQVKSAIAGEKIQLIQALARVKLKEVLTGQQLSSHPPSNIVILVADARSTGLMENTVSLVTVNQLFQWFHNEFGIEVLKEIFKVAKVGALIHISPAITEHDLVGRLEQFTQRLNQLGIETTASGWKQTITTLELINRATNAYKTTTGITLSYTILNPRTQANGILIRIDSKEKIGPTSKGELRTYLAQRREGWGSYEARINFSDLYKRYGPETQFGLREGEIGDSLLQEGFMRIKGTELWRPDPAWKSIEKSL